MDEISIPQKRCTECGGYFPQTAEYFYRKCDTKTGLASKCKVCASEYGKSPAGRASQLRHRRTDKYKQSQKKFKDSSKGKESQRRINTSEKGVMRRKKYAAKASTKQYRLEFSRTPEQKEKQRIRDNKPTRVLGRKQYALSNAGRLSRHRYKTSYKGRMCGKRANQVRRATIRGSDGKHSSSDIEIQLKSQKGLCWWCGVELTDKYHIDHRIPLIRGGSNCANNICISCPNCNLSKGSKLPHEWNGRLL